VLSPSNPVNLRNTSLHWLHRSQGNIKVLINILWDEKPNSIIYNLFFRSFVMLGKLRAHSDNPKSIEMEPLDQWLCIVVVAAN